MLLSDQSEEQLEGGDEDEDVEAEVEPEPVEDLETEELMRLMASKLTPAARFRWRRSRWLRYCPVALADGILLPGKTEFTVSYDVSNFFYTVLPTFTLQFHFFTFLFICSVWTAKVLSQNKHCSYNKKFV